MSQYYADADFARKIVVSPCEAFLLAFSSSAPAKRVWVKGRRYSLAAQLLGRRPIARLFPNDVFRLTPAHYHRFHAPVQGRITRLAFIPGRQLSTQPMTVHERRVSIFSDNVRCIVYICSPVFGTVALVIIAATCVSGITFEDPVLQAQKMGGSGGPAGAGITARCL